MNSSTYFRTTQKRLGKYGLTLHPQKTKLVEVSNRDKGRPSTFDFLGFTHYMGKSRKGKWILKRKTSKKKLKASLQRVSQWMKANRHKPVEQLINELNRKLQGHYGYYGMTFNYPGLNHYHHQVRGQLHKWLNRRGGKPKWCWKTYSGEVLQRHPLTQPRIIHKCF